MTRWPAHRSTRAGSMSSACPTARRWPAAWPVTGPTASPRSRRWPVPPPTSWRSTAGPDRPVPILQIHGAADHLAPYEGGRRKGPIARALLMGRGAPGRASASTHGPSSGSRRMAPPPSRPSPASRPTRRSGPGAVRRPCRTSSSTASTAWATPGRAAGRSCRACCSGAPARRSTRRASSGTSSRPTRDSPTARTADTKSPRLTGGFDRRGRCRPRERPRRRAPVRRAGPWGSTGPRRRLARRR